MTDVKQCTHCQKFNPITEFYKKGNRFEAICKTCKREARVKREKQQADKAERQPQQDFKNSALQITEKTVTQKPQTESKPAVSFDRIQMPVFDESVFYPEKQAEAFELSLDDVADITSVIRWFYEQNEKQKIKGAA